MIEILYTMFVTVNDIFLKYVFPSSCTVGWNEIKSDLCTLTNNNTYHLAMIDIELWRCNAGLQYPFILCTCSSFSLQTIILNYFIGTEEFHNILLLERTKGHDCSIVWKIFNCCFTLLRLTKFHYYIFFHNAWLQSRSQTFSTV